MDASREKSNKFITHGVEVGESEGVHLAGNAVKPLRGAEHMVTYKVAAHMVSQDTFLKAGHPKQQ